jgi:hypothetical protein
MAKVTINTHKSFSAPGEREMHFGYMCEVGPEGQLFADVPDELLQNELDNGRATLVQEEKKQGDEPKDQFTGMDRDTMKSYLDGKGVEYAQNIPGPKLLTLCRETAAGGE